MSEQTFPLGDFNDLESSVRNITQQSKPQKQQAKPQEQQMPKDADASKRDWMHFTFICSIEIVDKVKAIAHKEGYVPNGLGHSCRTDNAGRNRNLP